MASFRSQYGIRIARDLPDMKWREFAAYMAGLDGRTPLGRMISIRAENDPDILKQFTPEQRRIRDKWRSRKARIITKADRDAFLEQMKRILVGMAGSKSE